MDYMEIALLVIGFGLLVFGFRKDSRNVLLAAALVLLASGAIPDLASGFQDGLDDGVHASAPPAASQTTARAAFDQYLQAFWSEGDPAAIERAVSPAIAYHYNGMAAKVDHEQHRGALRSFREQFPDLEAVTDVYTENGAYGAAATTWTGTYSGTICGKQAAKPFTWSVNYIFRMEGDRIAELWETWDEGGLMKKLGVGPGACEA